MGKKKSAIRQQASRAPHIRRVQGSGIAQLALSLGALLRQNVTTMRMIAFETAGRSTLEAFRCAAIGLHLRHINLQQLKIIFFSSAQASCLTAYLPFSETALRRRAPRGPSRSASEGQCLIRDDSVLDRETEQ